jgi:hypothetical protein
MMAPRLARYDCKIRLAVGASPGIPAQAEGQRCETARRQVAGRPAARPDFADLRLEHLRIPPYSVRNSAPWHVATQHATEPQEI